MRGKVLSKTKTGLTCRVSLPLIHHYSVIFDRLADIFANVILSCPICKNHMTFVITDREDCHYHAQSTSDKMHIGTRTRQGGRKEEIWLLKFQIWLSDMAI